MKIAGTGHRPNKLGGYSKQAYHNLVQLALNWLSNHKEVTLVISGVALGWDQALAEAALRLKIPVLAAIPCLEQDKMWPKESKDLYNKIINHPLTTKNYISSLSYTNSCMQKRNEYMVDECDKILALWDGSLGGTANCINYADGKKEVINLYDKYKLSLIQ